LEEAVMKRSVAVLTALTVTLTTALSLAPARALAPAAEPACSVRWGSQPRAVPTGSAGTLADVRAGGHACFDRLVLDVDGDVDGYFVRYVDTVYQDGSGFPVRVRGGARLQVIATVPGTLTGVGPTPRGEVVDVSRMRTLRHVAWAGSFEGQTTLGVGVRAHLPYRVVLLDGPGNTARLVVDVAHTW
jgi:hypothetical protein